MAKALLKGVKPIENPYNIPLNVNEQVKEKEEKVVNKNSNENKNTITDASTEDKNVFDINLPKKVAKKSYSFYCSIDLMEKLEKVAKDKKTSTSPLIEAILETYVKSTNNGK